MKKTHRMGWLSIGIRQPESLADHSFRTALIGYILAKMEGADEERVLKLCLLHDLHETRTSDLNALNLRYLARDVRKAIRELAAGLPFGEEMVALSDEFERGKTREATIARDADKLEMLAQAKEYIDEGNPLARDWIRSARGKLKTKSARELARALERSSSAGWWRRYKF